MAQFCRECGAALREGAKFCPSCGSKVPQPTPSPAGRARFCRECGSPLREEAKFCPLCGTMIPREVRAEKSPFPASPASHVPPSGEKSPAPKAHVCRNCGSPLREGSKFCLNCGSPVAIAAEPSAETIKTSTETEKTSAKTEKPSAEPKPAAKEPKPAAKEPKPAAKEPRPAESAAPAKKKGHKGVIIFVALVLAGVFLFTAFVAPGFLRETDGGGGYGGGGGGNTSSASSGKTELKIDKPKGFSSTPVKASAGDKTVIGSVKSDGVQVTVDSGVFVKDTAIGATPLDERTLKSIGAEGKFEKIVGAVDIQCEGYDQSPLGAGVTFTTKIPKSSGSDDEGGYVFCYYDEQNKEIRYFHPDSIDTASGTMSIDLPHFSWWWSAKLTVDQQIELFLDEYCMSLAIQQDQFDKLYTELAPYARAKAEALGLTAAAAVDLAQTAINALGCKIPFKGESADTLQDLAGMTVSQFTALTRAYYENDKAAAEGVLDETLKGLFVESLKEGKFFENVNSRFKSEYVKEFVPGALEQFVANFGSCGYILGAIFERDWEGAAQAAGQVFEGYSPMVAIPTRAIRLLALGVNTWFTYWKAAQIEELYKVYKNGGNFLFGNSVEPRKRDSFLTYVNTASGLTWVKGIGRFYRYDKIEEVCKKYGWSFKDYGELPQRFREVFDQRAEDELMNYFETRAAQEETAEKLKSMMRPAIKSLMNGFSYGALCSRYYKEFFREEQYDVRARLERLVRIKKFLELYVDEVELNKSAKAGGQNWGDIINKWVSIASKLPQKVTREDKERAIRELVDYLKEIKLLKSGMDADGNDASAQMKSLLGEWVGEYETSSITGLPQVYRKRIVFSAKIDGSVKIEEYSLLIKSNGKPVSGEKESGPTTTVLKDGDYKFEGSTLIVKPSDDYVGGYLFKFSLSGKYTETRWYYDDEKEDTVDYEYSFNLTKKK